MLSTGLDGSPLLWQNGYPPSGGVAGVDRFLSPRGKYKRRLLSEEERRHRQSAGTKRAISTRSLMEGERRKVLGDMFLASFI